MVYDLYQSEGSDARRHLPSVCVWRFGAVVQAARALAWQLAQHAYISGEPCRQARLRARHIVGFGKPTKRQRFVGSPALARRVEVPLLHGRYRH